MRLELLMWSQGQEWLQQLAWVGRLMKRDTQFSTQKGSLHLGIQVLEETMSKPLYNLEVGGNFPN